LSDIALKRQSGGPAGARLADVAAALGVAAFGILLAAAGGFVRLSDAGGDNDSLLRLVQVRDLLAGQGWFDPVQYRMGPAGGFPMHWSRLVDAPIAALTAISAGIAGSQSTGESIALVLWPSLLLGVGAFLLVRAARIAYGDDAGFPALVVGALALVSVGVFQAGAIDHHNVQLVLTLGMCLGLLAGGFAAAAAAGACAALTLAVGMETLPYVATGGAVAAALFLVRGNGEVATARGFGLGFAAVAGIAFVATVAPSHWSQPACDAYSLAQACVALLAGLGLAAAASIRKVAAAPGPRLAALALVAAALATLVVLAFPQCLADPYAGLDPRLKHYWLDGVTEAQSLLAVARTDPAMLASWYATPALALAVVAATAFRTGLRRAEAIVAALLLAAVCVSVWQVRGGVFAVTLAALPLSGWIGRRRAASAIAPSGPATATLALAWILSFNAVWSAAGTALSGPSATVSKSQVAAVAGPCYRAADYAALAALPAATVLSISNLGSAILAHTPHRALSGSYHRNVAGNLAALDMLMAPAAQALPLLRAMGVGIVAVCPGNPETRVLAGAAGGGLLARLVAGDVPSWLEPLAGGGALRLYRVRDF
jgi:hypothetical protein